MPLKPFTVYLKYRTKMPLERTFYGKDYKHALKIAKQAFPHFFAIS
jgi:hypothetical protein